MQDLDWEGRPARLVLALDVTERERAEEQLRKASAYTRSLIEASLDPLVTISPEGKITDVNAATEAVTGRPRADLVGSDFSDYFTEPERAREGYRKVLADSRVRDYPLTIRHVSGRTTDVLYNASVYRDEAGQVQGVFAAARDITEKTRAENERWRLEERFRRALDEMLEGCMILGFDWKYLYVNEEAARHGHEKRENLLDRTMLECYPGVEKSEIFAHYRRCMEERVPERFESAFTFPDGSTDWFEMSVEPAPEGIFVLSLDISDRKRAEQAKEQYLRFFRLSLDPMAIADPFGCFTAVNPAFLQLTGYSESELLSNPFLDFVFPEDRERTASEMKLQVSTRPSLSFENRYLCKDGRVVLLSWTAFFDKHDGATYATARDITEIRRGEEALRRSEEKYRLFFEQNLAGHFISTPDGRMLACNPAFAQIFGFSSPEEARKRSIGTLYPSPEMRKKFLDRLRAEKRLERIELELRRADGQTVHVVENVIGVFDDEGKLIEIRGYLIDETERRAAEREFRQAQKMEAVGRLAGGVAHDFNNALTVILGYLEILQPSLAESDPRLAQLEEIRKAAERAASLTRQLLAFSRKQVLQPAVLDLNAVVRDVAKMLSRLIGEDIQLRTALAPGLGAVLADPGQIEQVLMNLAVNARDAMPKGGTLVIETADLDVDRVGAEFGQVASPGRYVMLAVTDAGCGMNATTMAHLFEPFFTTKEKGKGTGLGLATVYGIVKQSGGFIRVESELDRGSAFRVFLPRAAEERPRAAGPTMAGPLPTGWETILLAEDDAALRAMACKMLTEAGYTVLAASGADEALGLAASHPTAIDLLLTDVIMPGLSGPELARRLGERRPGVAVLYMSGYTDELVGLHGVLEPSIHFIQKPFTRSGLLLKVRETLAAKKQLSI
jgi:PAS domain S-box-containing protein